MPSIPAPPPRYCMAAAVLARLEGRDLPSDHPACATWNEFLDRCGPQVDQAGQLAGELQTLYQQVRADQQQNVHHQEQVQLAQEQLDAVLLDARPRFEREHPAGQAWAQAHQQLLRAQGEERQAIEAAHRLERERMTPEIAELLACRYGTPDYTGNRFGRLLDDSKARKAGFAAFLEQRQQVFAAVEAAERARVEAEDALVALEPARQAAWETQGRHYVDAQRLQDAQQQLGQAQLDHAMHAQDSTQRQAAAMGARRALAQHLAMMHTQHTALLQALAQELGQAPTGWPELPMVMFQRTEARSAEDMQRKDLLREAGQAFLGLGEHPDPCHGIAAPWPTWLLVTYGQADGLPGTLSAQSATASGRIFQPLDAVT